MTRIPVIPELLTWARERSGLDALVLTRWSGAGATVPRKDTDE